MSLYIGNDASNYKILHTTNSATSEADMKSGVKSNTIFHSRLSFMTCQIYTANYHSTEVDPTGIQPTKYVYQLPAAQATAVLSAYSTTQDSFIFLSASNIPLSVYYGVTDFTYTYSTTYTPTLTFILLKNLNTIGTVTTNQVEIDKTTVKVGALDLRTLQYLVTPAINTVDRQFSINGKVYQIINYVAKNTGVELLSNSTGSVIKIGGHPILGYSRPLARTTYYTEAWRSLGNSNNTEHNYYWTLASCSYYILHFKILTNNYDTYPPMVIATPILAYGASFTGIMFPFYCTISSTNSIRVQVIPTNPFDTNNWSVVAITVHYF